LSKKKKKRKRKKKNNQLTKSKKFNVLGRFALQKKMDWEKGKSELKGGENDTGR